VKDSFKSQACNENLDKYNECVKRSSALYPRNNDIRSDFERDYTRLLHCQAYRRLKHKTQVFFAPHNDHISTRMEHVNHVVSIATTIGKYLGLNEQLTSAIALGHDIGCAPFGQFGSDCLNGFLQAQPSFNEPKKFWAERNSLFFADYIETLQNPDGIEKPLDLTYAVRDGLICQCGPITKQGIKPRNDNLDLYAIKRPGLIEPYTWEGCVVKIADKIAYLGRDIEDARAYHILDMGSYRALREIVGSTLGFDNKGKNAIRSGKAVNTTVLINDMIVDLCNESSIENGFQFSKEYFSFIQELIKFNETHIYNHWRLKEFENYARNIIETIYRTLMRTQVYAQHGRITSALRYYPHLCETFTDWLIKHAIYHPENQPYRKTILRYDTKEIFNIFDNDSFQKCIIEYISGMTDQFAIQIYEEIITF
jgi:dGTPase